MRTYLDCYPCFLRQALTASRMAGGTETQQQTTVQKTLALLYSFSAGNTPPEIGYAVHAIVRKVVGEGDPYREVKNHSTREALALYPLLKTYVANSEDPLETAVRISIAGNIIDFGPYDEIRDLSKTVDNVLITPLHINHMQRLRAMLETAAWVLYLADNAGETVFDRVLIETLSVPVTYAVKDGPILNDAITVDAQAAGIDSCALIITNGTSAPGTILDLCSESFMKKYDNAPLIIAKGQANYETLSTAGTRVFCLLQVKCPVIGRDLGAPVGSIIVRQSDTPIKSPLV